MKTFSLILLCLSFNTFAADLFFPEGDFSCDVTYEEFGDISIESGDDFPTFYGHYETPIVKNVKLLFSFSQVGDEPMAVVTNPEVLPNWLLINKDQYENQTSWGYVSEEDDGIFYQVDWNGTWYFGSNIEILTKSFDGETLKVDLRFNDNDSTGELHRFVKCIKYRI